MDDFVKALTDLIAVVQAWRSETAELTRRLVNVEAEQRNHTIKIHAIRTAGQAE